MHEDVEHRGPGAAGSATHAYCLTRDAAQQAVPSAPPGLPGGGDLRCLPIQPGLEVVVSDVPLPEYSAAGIEASLQDVSWVSDRALAHEAVVEHFAAHGDVLPMKLFTLFADDGRAAAELAAQGPRLAALLDRVAGAEEWGVRVHFSRERARRAAVADAVPPATGRDFLERKRRQRDAAQGGAGQARAAAASAHRRLAAASREALEREVPAGSAVVLDAAYLVPKGDREGFRRTLSTVAEALAPTCDVTLTGPWPPYHFAGAGEVA